MKVIVAGQKWFGAEVLRLCARLATVLQVAAPAGDRVLDLAGELGVPFITQGDFSHRTMADGADLLVCAHWQGFVSPEVRARTRLGALGYHPSFLPRHRGRDAVEWAIRFGDCMTGGSVYWMDDGADTGPIAAQQACLIPPGATAAALWRDELAPMGLRLLEQVLADLTAGRVSRRLQDNRCATWEPRILLKPLRTPP